VGTKYLLYIDLLGFTGLVRRDPARVEKIYSVLNSLNVHSHAVFRTIVFSDTILAYNHEEPTTPDMHGYVVWYSIEFAEDLHDRLTGQDIYFRAVLLRGEFRHYRLKNVECFFGNALVDAYLREKEIPSLGLFIESECNSHNRYFRTAPFSKDLHFVYLNRSIENFHQDTQGTLPADDPCIDDSYPDLAAQVRFLQDVHRNMREHPEASVRSKFLTAWDFYFRRYPKVLSALAEADFDLSVLSPRHDWSNQLRVLRKNIEYFSHPEAVVQVNGADTSRA
jgi:hypothetical protein